MSWRIVVVSSKAKLDYQLNYLVIRKIDEVIKIHLSEIAVLMIESTAVSLTAYLISELIRHKIKVVFCDNHRNPQSELMPYYGCYDVNEKIHLQLKWDPDVCGKVWSLIIDQKICNQAQVLEYAGNIEKAEQLRLYASEIQHYDKTNREGFAAKVYFNALFGNGFSRNINSGFNAALNYGYTVVLSTFSREVVAQGYLTALGIFHDNIFNCFNLACDLMEPFRPVIDRIVYDKVKFEDSLNSEIKEAILNIFNMVFNISGKTQTLVNCIRIYTHSVFDALNSGNLDCLRFPAYEV